MRRGTTPTLVFTVEPVLDLSTLAEAWLTIRQAEVEITHSLPDLVPTEGGFSVTLHAPSRPASAFGLVLASLPS